MDKASKDDFTPKSKQEQAIQGVWMLASGEIDSKAFKAEEVKDGYLRPPSRRPRSDVWDGYFRSIPGGGHRGRATQATTHEVVLKFVPEESAKQEPAPDNRLLRDQYPEEWKPGYFAIGNSPSGDPYFLNLGTGSAAVWWWDHESHEVAHEAQDLGSPLAVQKSLERGQR